MVTDSNSQTTSVFARPWAQLIVGIICMVMIANLQYGWTLFVGPIGDKYHWGKAAIQVTFTIFVLLETWLVPAEGYLVDRFGPKWIVVIGGALCGIAWTMNSFADSLGMFYFAAAIGGIGAGGVYGTCIGNAVRWFPGRRGLAAGLTAAGFGMGSAATIIPIAHMIKSSGYEHTFLTFGLMQGIVVVVVGSLIMAPAVSFMVAPPKLAPGASRYQAKPLEMLKTPVFWVMYVMFVMMAAGGLMAVAQLWYRPADVRAVERPGVLRLGRDLQPVPLDGDRYLRRHVRDHQHRAHVHRQRHGFAARTADQCHGGQRKLAHGIHGGSCAQHRGGADGDSDPETPARHVHESARNR